VSYWHRWSRGQGPTSRSPRCHRDHRCSPRWWPRSMDPISSRGSSWPPRCARSSRPHPESSTSTGGSSTRDQSWRSRSTATKSHDWGSPPKPWPEPYGWLSTVPRPACSATSMPASRYR
jgi:hypothetical protein